MKWRVSPIKAAALSIAMGVNILLLTAVVSEMVPDNSTVAGKADWNVNLSTAMANVTDRKPIDAYGQILARPVFFKSREPFVPRPAPAPPVVTPPPPVLVDPGLVLGGVVIKSGVRKAYLFSRTGESGAWTSEGDDFMGWKVKFISKSGAKLEQTGRSIDLRLYPLE